MERDGKRQRAHAGFGRRVQVVVGAVVLFGAVAVWSPDRAEACSCAASGDAAAALGAAEVAFIGTAVGVQEVGGGDGPRSRVFRFEVSEALRGQVLREVDIHTGQGGGDCGITFEIGREYGLTPYRNGRGQLGAGICGNPWDPDELRDAAAPLPRPDGSGPVAFLVAARHADATLLALDASGRTLAYGFGTTPPAALGVCPGAAVAIGVVPDRDGGVNTLVSIDLRTLATEPITDLHTDGSPRAVVCLAPDGSRAVTWTATFDGAGVVESIVDGEASDPVDVGHPADLQVTTDGVIVRVDHGSGRLARTDVASGDALPGLELPDGLVARRVAVEPDGARVAVLAATPALAAADPEEPESPDHDVPPSDTLVVLDLSGSTPPTVAALSGPRPGTSIHWRSDDLLQVSWIGWAESTAELVGLDGTVRDALDVAQATVVAWAEAPAPDGSTLVLGGDAGIGELSVAGAPPRPLLSSGLHALVPVAGGPEVDPAAAAVLTSGRTGEVIGPTSEAGADAEPDAGGWGRRSAWVLVLALLAATGAGLFVTRRRSRLR